MPYYYAHKVVVMVVVMVVAAASHRGVTGYIRRSSKTPRFLNFESRRK